MFNAKLLPAPRHEIGSIQRPEGEGFGQTRFDISGKGSTLVLLGCRGRLRGQGERGPRGAIWGWGILAVAE